MNLVEKTKEATKRMLFQHIPKCPEHETPMRYKNIFVRVGGVKTGFGAYYCKRCDAYSSYDGMEKDPKKVAEEVFKRNSPQYRGLEIEILKV